MWEVHSSLAVRDVQQTSTECLPNHVSHGFPFSRLSGFFRKSCVLNTSFLNARLILPSFVISTSSYTLATMVKAIYNGDLVAESSDTVFVEGNHYFPPESIKAVLSISDTT